MIKSISSSSVNVTGIGAGKEDNASGGTTAGSLHKSHIFANCVVEKKRGFMPSDRHDPNKNKFLADLGQHIWQKRNEATNVSEKIELQKILSPPADAEETFQKKRKLYASSTFYSPILHPTVEDQVKLARKISHSLTDITNQQSRGQSMYLNRKNRSVKWVHEGSDQDLYVPKEISPESYAPPPDSAMTPSLAYGCQNTLYESFKPCRESSNPPQHNYQPSEEVSFSSLVPAKTLTASLGDSGSFLMTQHSHVRFSKSCGSNQLPKQQYLTPQRYKIASQTTAQNISPINFSPSPLPYDKLTKFENSTNDSCHNTSPTKFRGTYEQEVYTPSSLNNFSGNIIPTPQVTFNSNQLLNAPSYNCSPRGWQCSVHSTGYQAPQQRPTNDHKAHVVSAVNMPYTDF